MSLWGSTYCFTDVCISACVGFTQNLWETCFLFPRALAFDFCYDLDLCSQDQAVRAFLIRMSFNNFVKSGDFVKGDFDQTCHETS